MDDRMDGNDKSGGMKTRSRPGGEGPGRVRQSFSHGRTKSVVVETKRSKKLTKPG